MTKDFLFVISCLLEKEVRAVSRLRHWSVIWNVGFLMFTLKSKYDYRFLKNIVKFSSKIMTLIFLSLCSQCSWKIHQKKLRSFWCSWYSLVFLLFLSARFLSRQIIQVFQWYMTWLLSAISNSTKHKKNLIPSGPHGLTSDIWFMCRKKKGKKAEGNNPWAKKWEEMGKKMHLFCFALSVLQYS